jgi:hypothetical protein
VLTRAGDCRTRFDKSNEIRSDAIRCWVDSAPAEQQEQEEQGMEIHPLEKSRKHKKITIHEKSMIKRSPGRNPR